MEDGYVVMRVCEHSFTVRDSRYRENSAKRFDQQVSKIPADLVQLREKEYGSDYYSYRDSPD